MGSDTDTPSSAPTTPAVSTTACAAPSSAPKPGDRLKKERVKALLGER